MTERARQFHASPWLGVIHIAGGGTGFVNELMSTPGASASILEVHIPYAAQAMAELLGQAPEQAVADTTARLLAMTAYQRACKLGQGQLFGIGCSAALATNRKKKGLHRAHWAIQTAHLTAGFSTTFSGERADEEHTLVEYLWQTVQHVLLDQPFTANQVNVEISRPEDHLSILLEDPPNRHCTQSHDGMLLLPGSFNPLHHGHEEMLAVGERLTGKRGAYELSVHNADKPSLDFITLHERMAQMESTPLWLTNTPTYAEKAALFPGTTFLLGADTIARIGQTRFYADSPRLMQQALARFNTLGIRFLVFARTVDDQLLTLDDLALPAELRARCDGVPLDEFHNDVSSTHLRNYQLPKD